MPVDVVVAPYGRAAAEALRGAVASHKRDDPLAPVAVVVPTNAVGVTTRRLLASGALGPVTPHGAGVAAVTFLTVYRLAELLGAPALAAAGRRPVSTPVLGAAIRRVLARQPGIFAAVAEHPATEEALVDAFRELAQCDDTALDLLRRTGPRAADVVRVTGTARRALADQWYDERDLLDAATAAVQHGTLLLGDLGAVVLHLPQDVTAPGARLMRAIADVAAVTVVVGTTGDARADAPVHAAVARLLDGEAVSTLLATAPGGDVPHGTHVLSTSDPDDEVRTAVRVVVDALRSGVPLERVALLYGAADPYARLVHEQLDAAGIVHNGAAVRTLAQSVLGASLLAVLALPDRDFHRHDVMALLAAAPVHGRDGRPVPSARWERISRRAGVVRGAHHWDTALAREIDAREHELAAERDRTDRDPRPAFFEHQLAATRELRVFMTELVAELGTGTRPGATWQELAEWAQRLVDERLAGAARRADWPANEQAAADKVEAALVRLAGLDAVDVPPGIEGFRRTLVLELDADLGRIGRIGHGVYVGPVTTGLGLDLDQLVVCGLAEGTFPARVRDDSLLPDADRRSTEGALALHGDRVDADHRRFLAALAAAPERVLTFPRGDLRRTTERMPSRFLLDTVEALAGTRHSADELLTLSEPWLTVIPSFTAGITRTSFPATAQEHRLRVLLDDTQAGAPISTHPLRAHDLVLDRGLECTLARASHAFTRFDGNLTSLDVPSPARDGAVVSPTRLEAWVGSPFDYLMEQVLRVEIPELPEEVWELSPIDRGRLVHEILDDFFTEVLARDTGAPESDVAWSPGDRTRLRELARTHGSRYAAHGLTGRRVFWDRDQRRLLAELDRFLDEDATMRAGFGLVPIATELRFGFPGAEHPPVDFPLSDGRALHFRGAADRVDRGEHGELSVVDYKTGSPREILGLQLPVYTRAARAAFGDADTPVTAAYWYITAKHRYRWTDVPLVPEIERAVDLQLRTIVDGIERGLFPCALVEPGAWTRPWRTYADPDARGTRDRWREWERKRDAPELAGYVALRDSGADEAEDGP